MVSISLKEIIHFYLSLFSVLGISSLDMYFLMESLNSAEKPTSSLSVKKPALSLAGWQQGCNTDVNLHLQLLYRLLFYVDGSRTSHSLNKSRNARPIYVTTGCSFLYQDLVPKLKPSQNTNRSCAKENSTWISNTHYPFFHATFLKLEILITTVMPISTIFFL